VKKAEYQAAVLAAVLCAGILSEHDIPSLLAAIDSAESLGPLLDPTLWREKHQAMQEDREVLRAALPLWELAKKLEAEHA